MQDTERNDPRFADLDAWDSATIMAALWEGQMRAVAALGPALGDLARAVDAAVPRLRAGGVLAYAGAGTSGRIAMQDASELKPTFDWPEDRVAVFMAGGERAFMHAVEGAEDREDEAERAVAHLGANDVLIGLAASGTTPFTLAAIRAARRQGSLTVGIACSAGTPLLEAPEIGILLATGPEAIAGSTRMKAGTAQKAALNLFSTAVMVRLGRVYRGRMVDMNARNAKLERRAERMLAELADATPEAARAALAQAGGKVKLAVLVLDGLAPDEARALLDRHGGNLRAARGH
ncbi:MAG: N-acetylmuramic acid 6-phosphate etherase [Proteobacteria bacterium]|nr:N-acetylmuramic acid 6-phosphate etherase [Pseudomonadota bacterium]